MIRSFYFLFFNELFVEYVVHLLLYWPNLVLVWVFKEQQLKKDVHMIKLHILYGRRMCTSLSKQLKKDVHMIKKVQDMRVSSFEDHMDLIIVCPSSFFSNSSYRCLPFFIYFGVIYVQWKLSLDTLGFGHVSTLGHVSNDNFH